mmetsp:Transcript_1523/g.9373  ORF Transcript_1523/g.9373 Transcript_1523/m.9373 type:complete len:232 (+) Transcript_1523:1576-2271(+)
MHRDRSCGTPKHGRRDRGAGVDRVDQPMVVLAFPIVGTRVRGIQQGLPPLHGPSEVVSMLAMRAQHHLRAMPVQVSVPRRFCMSHLPGVRESLHRRKDAGNLRALGMKPLRRMLHPCARTLRRWSLQVPGRGRRCLRSGPGGSAAWQQPGHASMLAAGTRRSEGRPENEPFWIAFTRTIDMRVAPIQSKRRGEERRSRDCRHHFALPPSPSPTLHPCKGAAGASAWSSERV